MDRIDVLLKTFIATFGGFCGYFLGGWDATLKVLVTMAVIDYLTGMIAAGYNGELKSKVGFKGIAKKVVLFILVGAAAQLDTVLGSNNAIREATIFFMGNELLSLLENAGRMGIPLPQALTNAVEILGGKQKQEESKGEVK
ncbi:phage holin family protein [Bacillus thuringiensis]|uniref:phage holin family protein n=2 Tax=Bacillus thuringiensis TaxID=1428 RepID=UPI000A3CE613|nr:phage holin family protein [Bacillus thuringiensis]MED2125043.1 phage holin family protein [Bacillus thuringiensis]MED2146924.1 phage holin family protein [Bacillus thuringiensis]MED2175366.1 phage holin family protein [Bacillus thuringiensis]MED2478034.1 phage holin family protein [Bacillus thuringiensis]MED2578662.1 phage holin family protein [Bacillus thuringiensis]